MSRIGQRLEKTPEATFLRELDEENTNLRDAGRSRAATRWRHDASAHAALRRARHRVPDPLRRLRILGGPELVSAVSEAGGCGVLGGRGVPPEEIEGRIARVRELTDRPFGFNMIIADFEAPDSTDEDRA